MYYWEIWWGIAALIWILTILHSFVISKLRYKRKRILTPNKLCIAGTFLSATFLFCPVYVEVFKGYETLAKWAKSILISIQHSIRLFAFDGDYMDFVENVENIDFGLTTLEDVIAELGGNMYGDRITELRINKLGRGSSKGSETTVFTLEEITQKPVANIVEEVVDIFANDEDDDEL